MADSDSSSDSDVGQSWTIVGPEGTVDSSDHDSDIVILKDDECPKEPDAVTTESKEPEIQNKEEAIKDSDDELDTAMSSGFKNSSMEPADFDLTICRGPETDVGTSDLSMSVNLETSAEEQVDSETLPLDSMEPVHAKLESPFGQGHEGEAIDRHQEFVNKETMVKSDVQKSFAAEAGGSADAGWETISAEIAVPEHSRLTSACLQSSIDDFSLDQNTPNLEVPLNSIPTDNDKSSGNAQVETNSDDDEDDDDSDEDDDESVVRKFHEATLHRSFSHRQPSGDRNETPPNNEDDELVPPDVDDRCESDISGVADDSDSDLSSLAGIDEVDLNVSDVVRTYRHQPNPKFNSRLTLLAVSAVVFAIGIGVGHYIGSTRGSVFHQQQILRLKTLQDDYIICLRDRDKLEARLFSTADSFTHGTKEKIVAAVSIWRKKYEELVLERADLEYQLNKLKEKVDSSESLEWSNDREFKPEQPHVKPIFIQLPLEGTKKQAEEPQGLAQDYRPVEEQRIIARNNEASTMPASIEVRPIQKQTDEQESLAENYRPIEEQRIMARSNEASTMPTSNEVRPMAESNKAREMAASNEVSPTTASSEVSPIATSNGPSNEARVMPASTEAGTMAENNIKVSNIYEPAQAAEGLAKGDDQMKEPTRVAENNQDSTKMDKKEGEPKHEQSQQLELQKDSENLADGVEQQIHMIEGNEHEDTEQNKLKSNELSGENGPIETKNDFAQKDDDQLSEPENVVQSDGKTEHPAVSLKDSGKLSAPDTHEIPDDRIMARDKHNRIRQFFEKLMLQKQDSESGVIDSERGVGPETVDVSESLDFQHNSSSDFAGCFEALQKLSGGSAWNYLKQYHNTTLRQTIDKTEYDVLLVDLNEALNSCQLQPKDSRNEEKGGLKKGSRRSDILEKNNTVEYHRKAMKRALKSLDFAVKGLLKSLNSISSDATGENGRFDLRSVVKNWSRKVVSGWKKIEKSILAEQNKKFKMHMTQKGSEHRSKIGEKSQRSVLELVAEKPKRAFEENRDHKQTKASESQQTYEDFWKRNHFDPDDFLQEGFFESNQRQWHKHQKRLRKISGRIQRLTEEMLLSMDDDDVEDIYNDIDDFADDIEDREVPEQLRTWLTCQTRWWRSRVQRKHRNEDLVKGCGRQLMRWQLRVLCRDKSKQGKGRQATESEKFCKSVILSQGREAKRKSFLVDGHSSREGIKKSSQDKYSRNEAGYVSKRSESHHVSPLNGSHIADSSAARNESYDGHSAYDVSAWYVRWNKWHQLDVAPRLAARTDLQHFGGAFLRPLDTKSPTPDGGPPQCQGDGKFVKYVLGNKQWCRK